MNTNAGPGPECSPGFGDEGWSGHGHRAIAGDRERNRCRDGEQVRCRSRGARTACPLHGFGRSTPETGNRQAEPLVSALRRGSLHCRAPVPHRPAVPHRAQRAVLRRPVQDRMVPGVAAGLAASSAWRRRAKRRRRVAEPDLDSREFCRRSKLPLLRPAPGADLGRLAGRGLPARRDQPTTRLHRQPIPAALTTTSCRSAHQGRSGNLTA